MAGCRTLAAVRPSHLPTTVHVPVSIMQLFFRVLVIVLHGAHAKRDIILQHAA